MVTELFVMIRIVALGMVAVAANVAPLGETGGILL